MAASAIDTALYDITGKSTGKAAAEVMGGRIRDSVAVYATGLYYVDNYALEPHIKEAVGYVNQGFTGMKMKVGALSLEEDAERAAAASGAAELPVTAAPDVEAPPPSEESPPEGPAADTTPMTDSRPTITPLALPSDSI